jgi:hypothetical protein
MVLLVAIAGDLLGIEKFWIEKAQIYALVSALTNLSRLDLYH